MEEPVVVEATLLFLFSLPNQLSKPIIDIMKDNALLVIYYPNNKLVFKIKIFPS